MDTLETNNQPHGAKQSSCVSEEKLDERTITSLSGNHHPNKSSPPQHPDQLIQNKVAEHCRNGKDAMEKHQYERAVICFSNAISLQPEQAELYVNQGEAYLQMCDFQAAAACFNQACFMEPGVFEDSLAIIYSLQGQRLFDRGLFLNAVEAFSKAAEVKPECKTYKIRRLACLLAAGCHGDCLKQLDEFITESPSADLHVFRAQVHKQLNKVSLCIEDLKVALTLEPGCREAEALLQQLKEASEDARQQAVVKTLSGHLQEALCLINTALETSPRDGRLYLFRGTLYRRLKDFTSAIEDLVVAVELSHKEEVRREVIGQAGAKDQSPSLQEEAQTQLAITYNDFAVQCFSRGLYAEATLLLNKAVREEKSLAALYLNRGDCFFKQGEWTYALLDYQQAEEMLPPDTPAVQRRLAVIYNTLGLSCFQDGSFQKAVDLFTLAIKYNPTINQYYENRSKAFRRILHLREAREDLIRLLILDPSNKEVPPMLMGLFPGCSIFGVLSSTKGKAIRAELMEMTQTWNSSSDPPGLTGSVLKMTLTDDTSQSEKQTEGEKEETQILGEEPDESSAPKQPLLHHRRSKVTTHHLPAPPASTSPPSGDPECLASTSQQ